ncbi:hypothetical protein Hdeb2414_s0004g00132651 [Helianthus debilis subsp. tardiflorus]
MLVRVWWWVTFADVVARVPVTLDGAVAYTRWQEAIGAIADYLVQFSGFEPPVNLYLYTHTINQSHKRLTRKQRDDPLRTLTFTATIPIVCNLCESEPPGGKPTTMQTLSTLLFSDCFLVCASLW